jgi:hypothetical protein
MPFISSIFSRNSGGTIIKKTLNEEQIEQKINLQPKEARIKMEDEKLATKKSQEIGSISKSAGKFLFLVIFEMNKIK